MIFYLFDGSRSHNHIDNFTGITPFIIIPDTNFTKCSFNISLRSIENGGMGIADKSVETKGSSKKVKIPFISLSMLS